MNWFTRLTTAAQKVSKGVITFDFDRTLTIPHYEGDTYLFFGVMPNEPMIEKFKQYQKEGYRLFLLILKNLTISQGKRYERRYNILDNPAGLA